ncbi:hypothetical protein [Marinicella sp. W31]|uniref:hypothetical protein n=1 Tax=Marinicella sp. W31 TaxID=3023713 RepID=UPI003756EE93
MKKLSFPLRQSITVMSFVCVGMYAQANESVDFMQNLPNYQFQSDNAVARSISSRMHLGHWKQNIADKIYPRFFDKAATQHGGLLPLQMMSVRGAKLYYDVPDYLSFDVELDLANTFFTFEYDNFLSLDTNTSNRFTEADVLLLYNNGQILSRSLLVPGFSYRLQNNSEFNFSVVFAQQNYSDTNFVSKEINGLDQFDLYSISYTENREGLGIRLGFSQQLNDKFGFTASFQNRIDMEGFSRLLGVQADPADFDIPAQVDVAFNYNINPSNKLSFKVHQDQYSEINAYTSPSYPRIFLTFLNDLESPDFAWRDLTFYSAAFEHTFADKETVITLEYTGRQQPLATDSQLATILEATTSSYSMRLGIGTKLLGGQFDFYGSYASKPLNFGRTDFGRVENVLSGAHKEAVMSWTYHF